MENEYMSITIISITGKKNSDSCYLKLSNDETLTINLDIISKYSLAKSKSIDNNTLELITRDQRIIDIKKCAYRFASYKPRSVYQIQQKLKEKGYIPEEIKIAIKFLLEFNLLDDNNFAESFVKNKANNKKYGINRIRLELKKAGINNEIIEHSINEFYPMENCLELAKSISQKKMKIIANKPIEKQRNSLIQFLIRQGYNWDIINNVLKDILNSEEENL